MAIFFPNQSIQELNSNINVSGSSIVQIVEQRSTATLSCANWNTGNFLFSATITPTSTASSILVYAYMPYRMDAGAGKWSLGYYTVTRSGGPTIITSGWGGTWRNVIGNMEKTYLDSPATTSTVTYNVYVYNFPAEDPQTTLCYWNNSTQNASDGYAYLRLTEISG